MPRLLKQWTCGTCGCYVPDRAKARECEAQHHSLDALVSSRWKRRQRDSRFRERRVGPVRASVFYAHLGAPPRAHVELDVKVPGGSVEALGRNAASLSDALAKTYRAWLRERREEE